MISLIIHVYEFLNIGTVFPVRNGFQQDLFSPTGIMKLSKTARVLNEWWIFNFPIVLTKSRRRVSNFKKTDMSRNCLSEDVSTMKYTHCSQYKQLTFDHKTEV